MPACYIIIKISVLGKNNDALTILSRLFGDLDKYSFNTKVIITLLAAKYLRDYSDNNYKIDMCFKVNRLYQLSLRYCGLSSKDFQQKYISFIKNFLFESDFMIFSYEIESGLVNGVGNILKAKNHISKKIIELDEMKGSNSILAFVQDPDGYKIELLQR